jgi:hypothetical protein
MGTYFDYRKFEDEDKVPIVLSFALVSARGRFCFNVPPQYLVFLANISYNMRA